MSTRVQLSHLSLFATLVFDRQKFQALSLQVNIKMGRLYDALILSNSVLHCTFTDRRIFSHVSGITFIKTSVFLLNTIILCRSSHSGSFDYTYSWQNVEDSYRRNSQTISSWTQIIPRFCLKLSVSFKSNMIYNQPHLFEIAREIDIESTWMTLNQLEWLNGTRMSWKWDDTSCMIRLSVFVW